MRQLHTTGIVLSRTNFGEADRIVTLLTPNQGKLRLMARGARRIKSRLAGGIELFSVSDIIYMPGRKEIGTLMSSRLIKHYGTIVQDLDRVQLGYELIKTLHKVTEDITEAAYFDLLDTTFAALDDATISLQLITCWFQAQLLKLAGVTPNLHDDTTGTPLIKGTHYSFDDTAASFTVSQNGRYQDRQIKVLRLLFADYTPAKIAGIVGVDESLAAVAQVTDRLYNTYLLR